jgi:hypothetical protein
MGTFVPGVWRADVIAYGALCTWWDDKTKVATKGPLQLPCCPFCSGVLFEIEEDEWMAGARSWLPPDDSPFAGIDYPTFLVWCRGKCFPSHEAAVRVFKQETTT